MNNKDLTTLEQEIEALRKVVRKTIQTSDNWKEEANGFEEFKAMQEGEENEIMNQFESFLKSVIQRVEAKVRAEVYDEITNAHTIYQEQGITKNQASAIHKWLYLNYESPKKCEGKDCEGKSKVFDWALKTGKKYEKNRENFIRLCRKCHALYDIRQKDSYKYNAALNSISNIVGKRVLTFRDVQTIRERYKKDGFVLGVGGTLTREALAKEYGVSKSTIGNIVRGKTWKVLLEDQNSSNNKTLSDKCNTCGHWRKDHGLYAGFGRSKNGSRYVCHKNNCNEWNLCDLVEKGSPTNSEDK